MKFAVLDIETTGGNAQNHRITEISIILTDGKKIIDKYETLVNPERPIPPFISSLTGITDEMVLKAPIFEEVAESIDSITKDSVIVAHSVNFDYGFIRTEFNRIGKRFQRKKLCTVRLSRKLLPNLFSYSLGKIATQLGYTIENRHRAGGDTAFTYELFKILLEKDQDGFIELSLNQRSREAVAPPNLDVEKFKKIPNTQGIYRFHDQKGKILYIGKAKRLKSRIEDHFRGTTNTASKDRFVKKIYDVSFEEIKDDLITLLKEAEEIKKNWPPFNRSFKSFRLNYGIIDYFDQNGYGRIAITEVGKHHKPLLTFNKLPEARNAVYKLVDEFNLCLKLTGLESTESSCTHYLDLNQCNGACIKKETVKKYNNRYQKALQSLELDESTYVLEGEVNKEERSVVLIEKGRYKGFGYVPQEESINSLEGIKNFINSGYDDKDMQGIIRSFLKRSKKYRKIEFNPQTMEVLQ